MLVTKDKPELWQVCTVKAGDQATMEYGGPYWQLFSSHLTKENHEKLQAAYPHIHFPPVWPHPPSNELGHLTIKKLEKLNGTMLWHQRICTMCWMMKKHRGAK
jgi:hypothetical protein